MIKDRKIQLLYGQDTIGELMYLIKNHARHNISDVRLRIQLLQFIAELFYYSTSVNTMKTEYRESKDPYDDMFLKCAIEGKADYLVTNDFKHGLHKRDDEDFHIVSSEEFIKLYIE